jgi:hypothetical protein
LKAFGKFNENAISFSEMRKKKDRTERLKLGMEVEEDKTKII